MQGRVITGADVEALAKLPPFDVLRSQVVGAIIGPLNAIAALINAPLQNLYGLIDARIEQLGDANPPAADSLVQEPADTQQADEHRGSTLDTRGGRNQWRQLTPSSRGSGS